MSIEINKIEVRYLNSSDFKEFRSTMLQAYPNWEGEYWKEKHIDKLLKIFPEGQIAVIADDVVVGCALALRVRSVQVELDHTYNDIIDNYKFTSHHKDGDVLYGIDVFIHPEYRGLRLGRRLYDARKELCEELNLKSIMFGGRIPNYTNFKDKLTPKEYLHKVRQKEIHDPVLIFQLNNDFFVRKILKGYLPEDRDSSEYAVLMEWSNIYYSKTSSLINVSKTVIRLGLVQWQMRRLNNLEEFFEQSEFFIDALSGYNSDFVLFPELFNAPLMGDYNHLPESEAIRKLAEYTEPIMEKFQELAISYNTNIITGSMPCLKGGELYNVGYLCQRSGVTNRYEKIHITPNEKHFWGMVGGDEIKVFDTDCGKIGVLICYDIEFPELGRIMAEQGLNILFVPFLTDTQNGFTRVKRCAQARAIENECYVAIAGSIGNLPKVNNMDIQYAESAVFTPSDFGFPYDGVKAQATPNSEMTLIVDVDLDLLKELHNYGSVTNLKDRRTDVYEVRKLK